MMLVKVDNESRINNHNFKAYVIEDLGVNISELDMNLFMKGLTKEVSEDGYIHKSELLIMFKEAFDKARLKIKLEDDYLK